MLDKETVTIQAIYETEMDKDLKLDQKETMSREIDPFLECVDRAKEHLEDKDVKECFDKVQILKKDL